MYLIFLYLLLHVPYNLLFIIFVFKDLEADTDAIMGEDTAPATTSGGTEVPVSEGPPRSSSSQSGNKKDQQQTSSSSPDQGQGQQSTTSVTAASEKKEVSKDGI